MIVCRECGNRNSDPDTFCGSCGSFLEWTGEKSVPVIAPKVVEEARAQAGPRPNLMQRIVAVLAPPAGGPSSTDEAVRFGDGSAAARPPGPPGVSGGPATAAPPRPGLPAPPGTRPAAPPPAPPLSRPAPPLPSAVPAAPPPPPPPPPPPDSDPVPSAARTLAYPQARETEPPGEVTPQAIRPRPVPVQAAVPTRRLTPGDLVCGECGESNPPTRRFCSRCGDSLASAVVVRRRWWQRVLRRRRGPRTTDAGTRPQQAGAGGRAGSVLRTIYRRVMALVAAVFLAVGVAYLIYAPLRPRVDAVVMAPVNNARSWVDHKINPKFVAVRPVTVSASAADARQAPDLAVDQYSNTAWEAHWQPTRPPTLTVTFAGEVDLSRLVVTSGTAEKYTDFHRPAKLHLVYSTNRSDSVTVQDDGKPQTISLASAKGVTSVQIQITEIYQSVKGKSVALSEVEFFARD